MRRAKARGVKVWVCVVGWRGVWRGEVGCISFSDELAGICKRWITRQQESIIQGRKRKKKKHGSCDFGPRVPFPIQRVIFLKCRGKEKQPWRKESEMMRTGRKEKKERTTMCSYPHSLSPWSNPEVKEQCENAKGYYQTFRVHQHPLWWMSVGFRKASCQTLTAGPL